MPPPFDGPPPATPQLFEEGLISTDDYELNAVFSSDLSDFYFTRSTPDSRFRLMSILVSKSLQGEWQTPEMASFSGQYSEADVAISPDGSRLFYISQRPLEGIEPNDDFDIWYVNRQGDDWGEPINAGPVVNSDGNDYYPGVASNGTLYFSAQRDEGLGSYDIYRSRFVNGEYQTPENLGPAVNSESAEIDLFISPDESYLIFVSYRQGGQGRGDLYMSHNIDGEWSQARNLGDIVNTAQREYTPSVSPDGQILFFTSERGVFDSPPDRPLSFREFQDRIDGPGNGLGDIYYVAMDAVEADN